MIHERTQRNHHITKTCLFKYTENFITKKWKFSDKKKFDSFHISAQNIDCWYSLEPPQRGGSNEYQQSMFLSRNEKNNVYPCKPQFYYIKVGFKGAKIIWAYFRDDKRTTILEHLDVRLMKMGVSCLKNLNY